jgi:glutathione synthase/RimK-type ligase-like ATP-grasp enzyme
MPTIALATYASLPALADDEYPLITSLARLGIQAEPAVWDDVSVDWSRFDAAVIRSCWDYHLRAAEFFAWVERVESLGVAIWNPPSVLRWNSRKTYLRDLAAAGVRTVPTVWVDAATSDDGDSLVTTLEHEGWTDAVVKPVVSASAHDTWKLSRADAAADPAHDARLERIAAAHGAMVQPLVHEIATDGEWSLQFFGGSFSHAVVQRAAPGDFRVQREFGGTFERVDASPTLICQAEAAVLAAPGRTVYARVDGVVVGGDLVVTELELLEPALFLDADHAAPDRFAAAIAREVTR